MFRLTGFFMIMLGSCGCGFGMVKERKAYLKRCRAWQELLAMMEHEIAFRKASLPEMCERLGARLSGRRKVFIERVGRSLAEHTGDTLGEVWKREAAAAFLGEALKGEIQREVEDLGEKLCFEEGDMQEKVLREIRELLKKHEEEQERADREKNRLTLCAGIMGGLMLIVLLL